MAIPDDALRCDALQAIHGKRANIDGAALFWTLPRVRSRDLLRLLVAYEILADFLDCTSERGAHIGIANGLLLHRALTEALDPRLHVSGYYRLHPWSEDGGYLSALVDACRQGCLRLPSYGAVWPLATHAARLAQVLALNHEPDPTQRDVLLMAWAATHSPSHSELTWFEWTGGASAWLTILALLAFAADPGRRARDAKATYAAYLPWVSLAGTMLDSYGDTEVDTASGAHSYIAHYPDADVAARRLAEIIRRSLDEAASLRDGPRHVVIASCMIAMYLSKDSVRTPERRPVTINLALTGKPLTRLLVPVLRAWRIFYNQRAA